MKYKQRTTIHLTHHVEYRTFPENCTFIAIKDIIGGGYDVCSYHTIVETILALTGKSIGSVVVTSQGDVTADLLDVAPENTRRGELAPGNEDVGIEED